MAPSRGPKVSPSHDSSDDLAVQQQSDSALRKAKRNLRYLISPSTTTDRPGRLRTRALLRTFSYIGQFIIWRLVRWAKYVAIGGLVAAVSATAVGSVMSGVAWIAAPPTIGASIFAAVVWGVGKYVAGKLHKRWKNTGQELEEAEDDYENDHPVIKEGAYGQELGPQTVPW